MIRFTYPARWRYDILRALDYFRLADSKFDERMQDAFDIILKKRKPEGYWLLSTKYAGKTHFEMEKTGKPSRWNTPKSS